MKIKPDQIFYSFISFLIIILISLLLFSYFNGGFKLHTTIEKLLIGYFLGAILVSWLIFIVPFLGFIDSQLRKGKIYGMIFPFVSSIYGATVYYIMFFLVYKIEYESIRIFKSIEILFIPAIVGFVWGVIYVLFAYLNFYRTKSNKKLKD